MAITRAQQAKQMLQDGGMLVKPRADGKRPGYYGPDAGHENDPGHGSNAPGVMTQVKEEDKAGRGTIESG